MKTYSLEEVTSELIGKKGTVERDLFEYELQMGSIRSVIKHIRKKRNLTRQELRKIN